MRKGTKRLLGALAGLVIVLVGAEAGARLALKPPIIKGNQIPDPLVGFRHQSNRRLLCHDEHGDYEYRLNSEGFRGPELPRSPPDTEGRVLLVGDSFVNAWGVREEDWVGTRLRERLAAAGRPSTVNALCADDIGTGQELLFLGKFASRVRPTEVVLFVFPSNDVVNNSLALAGRTTVSPGDYFRPYLERDAAGNFTRRYALPVRAWFRQSRLFALLEAHFLSKHSQDELLTELCPGRIPQSERLQAGLPPFEYMEIFRPPPEDSPWRQGWRDTEDLLLGFADRCHRIGARLLVVVIPGKIQVEDAADTEAAEITQRTGGQRSLAEMLDLDYPESRLESFFHEHSIDHVCLLDALRRESVERHASMYIHNSHLGALAHHVMADLVADWVVRSGTGLCFRPGPDSRPVPMQRILPDLPLHVDFLRDPRPELFDPSWPEWEHAWTEHAGGWPLHEVGNLLVPGSGAHVTLSGVLAPDAAYPVELTVNVVGNRKGVLARESYDAAGPFTLSFESPASEPGAWVLVRLAASGPRSGPYRLRLRSLDVRAP